MKKIISLLTVLATVVMMTACSGGTKAASGGASSSIQTVTFGEICTIGVIIPASREK